MAVLTTGYEGPDFVAAEFMPFQAQPRFSLADDLGFYQGRAMGVIEGNDQLHTGERRCMQASLDKRPTEAHVGHSAQRDNTSLCPQLDTRIYAFALSPTMFHARETQVPCPWSRLGGMGLRL